MSERPLQLTGLDHVVFLVDDMAKALEFYCGFLGCPRAFSYPSIGMEQVWVGPDLIVLWDVTHPGAGNAIPPRPGGRNVDHICVTALPFDHTKFRAYCAENDVKIELEDTHGGARGVARAFYVRDPFGNRIEIKGPPEYPDGTA